MLHSDYFSVYEPNYYGRSDGIGQWEGKKLRYGDMLACIAYTLGYKSFAEFSQMFGEDATERYKHNTFDKGEGWFPPLSAVAQLDKLKEKQTRFPQSVVDIGSGRGELPASMVYMGIKCQSIEPHTLAEDWSKKTCESFFGNQGQHLLHLINLACPECLDQLAIEDVDTVTFCESIEHIPEDCFEPVWTKLKEALQRNHGMLVVVNWLCGHPIGADNREHCRRIDDQVFDNLAEGGTTIVRLGSHLVVQY